MNYRISLLILSLSLAGTVRAQLIVPQEVPTTVVPPRVPATLNDISSTPTTKSEDGADMLSKVEGSWYGTLTPPKGGGGPDKVGLRLEIVHEGSSVKATLTFAIPTPEGVKALPPEEWGDWTPTKNGFTCRVPHVNSGKATAFELKNGAIEAVDEDNTRLVFRRNDPESEKLFQNATPLSAEQLDQAREAAVCASCANNLKQLGLVCKMYANESKGMVFPELSPQAGQLMWILESVYPEYLTDPVVMTCPNRNREANSSAGKPDPKILLADRSYIYLGYAITDDEEFSLFVDAYKARAAAGGKFDTDLTTASNSTIHRLREGVEAFFVTDSHDAAASAKAQSRIPVLVERPGNHPGAGNVLFMDGHVERRKCPGEFPYSAGVLDGLKKLEALGENISKQ